MSWLSWAGIGSGGLALIALVAGLLLAPAATIRFVGELIGWVLDKGRQAVRWLRKPGNGRRALKFIGFLILFVWGTAASLSSWQKNSTIIVVTKERDSAVTAQRAAEETLKGERLTWSRRELQFADLQRQQTAALAKAQAASAEATARAEAEKARADRGYGDWLKVYRNRSDVCRAAEEALDVACSSLGPL